jgi:hypothetical protein
MEIRSVGKYLLKLHESGKIKSVKHSPYRKLWQNRMTN